MPDKLDPYEPAKVARAVAALGLSHVGVTAVDRDDLDDGGAAQFVAVIREIRAATPDTTIEGLTPDFLRKPGAIEAAGGPKPVVFNHKSGDGPRVAAPTPPRPRPFPSLARPYDAK